MQILYRKFDKSKIPTLPRVLFEGNIVVVNGEAEAQKAVDYLLRQKRVGIDTETRPNFKRGRMNMVSLLQIATDEVCFLFRLNRIGLPACVVSLLQDENVAKVGLSLNDDFSLLRHRCPELKPNNVIEIQKLAPQLGIEDLSLQKLYANVKGAYISKRQQLTNWEADSLSLHQLLYAATDAWACLRLLDGINELMNTHNYQLIENDDENISETR